MKQAFLEAGKEFFRVVVLAAIPVIIDGLAADEFNVRLIGITAAVAGLRFIDKFLHEKSKEEPSATRNTGMLGEKGLTGF